MHDIGRFAKFSDEVPKDIGVQQLLPVFGAMSRHQSFGAFEGDLGKWVISRDQPFMKSAK